MEEVRPWTEAERAIARAPKVDLVVVDEASPTLDPAALAADLVAQEKRVATASSRGTNRNARLLRQRTPHRPRSRKRALRGLPR